jgi:hypothetical protein
MAGKICAAGESFPNRVAGFAWIAKSRSTQAGIPGTNHESGDKA